MSGELSCAQQSRAGTGMSGKAAVDSEGGMQHFAVCRSPVTVMLRRDGTGSREHLDM